MKKLTSAQRRKIYMKAAKSVLQDDYQRGCCWAIKISGGGMIAYDYRTRKKNCPEFALFSQPSEWYWKWNQDARCIAMLLCAEMCLTENL